MTTALIVLAHGSTDSRWQAPFETLEQRLKARMTTPVRLAYMELCDPLLENVVAELHADGFNDIDILPLFFAAGRHLREDVPGQLDALRQTHPELSLTLLDPVGQHPSFADVVVSIVAENQRDSTCTE
ncbi:sirohydrochlorin chelatase [Kushneria marisflavi]|uniref:Cobalamin biosynthesis protein CbiX n=1 Tax=Kushneria marisflavi TaxID=157779 RepID=A0A240UQ49_9GAMM|nr:CbiX/SirB N-terminal domain-containing protein [Kushneria marisflavi]ART63637.1 cobalamin biosynthesis protein CbiX [Kushneria marisflavi]RKD85303.1 sirohydrochlorin cobaltochelatase [Kushneria marisflavi]